MSQRAVEVLLGKLVTDESFRRKFKKNRATAILDLNHLGLDLTPVERTALLALDLPSCDRFARRLDSRIRKMIPDERDQSP